jgi:hypothetical protein
VIHFQKEENGYASVVRKASLYTYMMIHFPVTPWSNIYQLVALDIISSFAVSDMYTIAKYMFVCQRVGIKLHIDLGFLTTKSTSVLHQLRCYLMRRLLALLASSGANLVTSFTFCLTMSIHFTAQP